MRQHALRWTCRAKSHEPQVFDRKEAYENHMREKHRTTFTDEQLLAVSARNGKSRGPLFASCPLCAKTEENLSTTESLLEHIVTHLRFLALKSLPFVVEVEYNSNSSQSVCSDDGCKPADRSTLTGLLHEGAALK